MVGKGGQKRKRVHDNGYTRFIRALFYTLFKWYFARLIITRIAGRKSICTYTTVTYLLKTFNSCDDFHCNYSKERITVWGRECNLTQNTTRNRITAVVVCWPRHFDTSDRTWPRGLCRRGNENVLNKGYPLSGHVLNLTDMGWSFTSQIKIRKQKTMRVKHSELFYSNFLNHKHVFVDKLRILVWAYDTLKSVFRVRILFELNTVAYVITFKIVKNYYGNVTLFLQGEKCTLILLRNSHEKTLRVYKKR